ncbi:lysozyme inhibitor LprI family protein [Bacillus sp. EB01]|uniref:lysozyme inhibitor LprI family protein n=1 Tax=Bacillus sp. EB01 TaxID=1347086 RepID=UPI0005C51E77|nr:lysozyme inhibitor LprI family protein [Bacillus sp. EB01]
MKSKRLVVVGVLTAAFGLLTACGKPADESSSQQVNGAAPSSSELEGDGLGEQELVLTEQVTVVNEDGSTEIYSEDNSISASSDGEEFGSQGTGSLKDEYLKKLNEMEEEDRRSAVGTTTAELEEQEAERYEKWDKVLNKIYRVLEEQLSPEQMEKVREEQRSWVKQRDEAAKESSLKYKGGSHEALEYVATQAILTRERCYALVAKYMG